jgi:ABC-type Fe3+-siderophore transport system permease subunit
MLFFRRECLWLADACRESGAAITLLIILIAAGRGGFSPHRMLLAGMALSTAFTMLLMMLQASGDPRMAKILTGFRLDLHATRSRWYVRA